MLFQVRRGIANTGLGNRWVKSTHSQTVPYLNCIVSPKGTSKESLRAALSSTLDDLVLEIHISSKALCTLCTVHV